MEARIKDANEGVLPMKKIYLSDELLDHFQELRAILIDLGADVDQLNHIYQKVCDITNEFINCAIRQRGLIGVVDDVGLELVDRD